MVSKAKRPPKITGGLFLAVEIGENHLLFPIFNYLFQRFIIS